MSKPPGPGPGHAGSPAAQSHRARAFARLGHRATLEALGARRASVYRLVLGEASWLIGIGTALGTIGAVIAATLMRRLLFGVQSWDPPTLITAALVLAAAALAASYLPARRAASVNPIEVLRAE